MRFKRKQELTRRFVDHIREIYRHTEHFHFTHDKLCKEISEKIWSNKNYQSLPSYNKGYISGVRDTIHGLFFDKTEDCWIAKGADEVLTADKIGGEKQPQWQDVEFYGRFYKDCGKPFYFAEGKP